MITKETIDKILETVRVEEVVNEFVTLKKRGVNFLGLCPFHDEKTPSFSVSPSRGIYKCFGCGKGGDAVRFLMDHEHYTYPEALKFLAKKYNIEIEEKQLTPEDQVLQNERESIYIALSYASKYFSDYLHNTEEGKSIGLSYLKERGISSEMIEKFNLGFSPTNKTEFYDKAIKEGYKADILEKAGLIIKMQSGDYIDRYNERIIFPIFSISGRVTGFGGRIIKSNTKLAKYINSPETIVYNKSKSLFGLNLAKTEITKTKNCILVEGYTDVIAMHQSGIENVVASSGTSLTIEQVRLINRFTENIIFLLDSDEAGTGAVMRGIDLALKGGLNAYVIGLPKGDDPDSFAQKNDSEAIKEYFEKNRQDFIRFKISVLLKGEKDNPKRKVETAREIVTSIAYIPDLMSRTEFIKYSSQLLSMDERVLSNELNKALFKKAKEDEREHSKKETENEPDTDTDEFKGETYNAPLYAKSAEAQEAVLFRLLMAYGNLAYEEEVSVASKILEELEKVTIKNDLHKKIINVYYEYMENEEIPSLDHFVKHEDEKIKQLAIDVSLNRYHVSENWNKRLDLGIIDIEKNYKKEIKSVLIHFMLKKVKELLVENNEKIKVSAEEELEEHLKVQAYLIEMKRKLSEELKSVVI